MAKIDIKELLLKILPLILPAIADALPAEELGKRIKEKLIELLGVEAGTIVAEAIAKLLEEIVVGLRE